MSEHDHIDEPDLKDDDEAGYDDHGPTLATLADALQCWSITNDNARYADDPKHNGMTIAEAAMAFCVAPDRITAAVNYHPWMFLIGAGTAAQIQHEGE